MEVYVVRWQSMVNEETECGNFDYCYANEADASEAMLEDMDNDRYMWSESLEKERGKPPRLDVTTSKNDRGLVDFCSIELKEDDTYDYREWWIDKLTVHY